MPYTMKKDEGGGYTVTSPHGVKGRHMTLRNAHAQMNLLRGIEHGWQPTGRAARKRKKKKVH